MKHKEYELQKQVCEYLNAQYPDVLYMSDTIASVKLTLPQGARNKAIQKQGFKTPDLIIFEPNKHYFGLFIELKTESPYKKNGEIKSNEHLQGQEKTLKELIQKGYDAGFAWSFEMTKEIIDIYMRLR